MPGMRESQNDDMSNERMKERERSSGEGGVCE